MIPQFSSVAGFLPRGERDGGEVSQPPHAHNHPPPRTRCTGGCTPRYPASSRTEPPGFGEAMPGPPGRSGEQDGTHLFLRQRKASRRRLEQRSTKPPMSSITSSVEPGEGGQRQPPGAPSHPSAPMGARSPPGATREGKSTCFHGMGLSGSVGAWSTHKMMLRPRDRPLMAPTCLLRVQGNARDGCAAGRVAGGHGDLLGDTGHCRAEWRP